ncbi:MAG: HPr(Ser) kinase/phosphatase [Deltaproteobacteria bacterium]|nr:HPr(Ser) kinase/phosphatase [Deltaproteobacteria bacterium]
MSEIAVGELLGRGELEVTAVAGTSGLARTITVPRIQKPGLALAGWPEQLHPNRMLVLGGTEIDYLKDHEHTTGLDTMMSSDPACVVVCRGLEPPAVLRDVCESKSVPLLVSGLVTADFIAAVTSWMSDRLAPQVELHGVLMDVNGIGVLLLGKSGIGKSETALDLVVRGHRLVADDVIKVRAKGGALVGRGAGILGHHMEVRGLGIINIEDLYGVAAVRSAKKIELVVELHEWIDSGEEYDRLGFDDKHERILDINVPKIRLPVKPGRNLATLTEVAARNQLLKVQGTHSARAFRDQLHAAMEAEAASTAMDAVE